VTDPCHFSIKFFWEKEGKKMKERREKTKKSNGEKNDLPRNLKTR
jgi:hypothetical protein